MVPEVEWFLPTVHTGRGEKQLAVYECGEAHNTASSTCRICVRTATEPTQMHDDGFHLIIPKAQLLNRHRCMMTIFTPSSLRQKPFYRETRPDVYVQFCGWLQLQLRILPDIVFTASLNLNVTVLQHEKFPLFGAVKSTWGSTK
jgi:hypothetical protein